jgi:hypothetical protein
MTWLPTRSPADGVWLGMASPVAAELAAGAGFTWALIDLEHGAACEADALRQIQILSTTGTTAIVRLPSAGSDLATRLLDAGAAGLMAPHVEDAATAAAFAMRLRYPPRGRRGVSASCRAAGYGADWPAYRFNFIYGREQDFEAKAERAVKNLGAKNAALYRELRRSYQENGEEQALDNLERGMQRLRETGWRGDQCNCKPNTPRANRCAECKRKMLAGAPLRGENSNQPREPAPSARPTVQINAKTTHNIEESSGDDESQKASGQRAKNRS